MQKLIIAGNIGRNAEVRQTQAGDQVASFSVAVSNGKDDNGNWRDSTWFDCSLWGKRANALAPYLTKGTRVVVEGRPSARQHDGKVYLQCNVGNLTLLGGGEQAGHAPRTEQPQSAPTRDLDDEIPF